MPMPTTDADQWQSAERRLHPLSWLFVLLQQLRQFLLPLIVLVLFGAGNRNEWWGLLAVIALVLVSIWQFYTYRYSIGSDSLQVRSGLFERTLREIPFHRIHNVDLRQSALHRLFGVAEVQLESAAGKRPEAEMRVLSLADAQALEALIRSHAPNAAGAQAGPTQPIAAPAVTVLLALPLAEVVRLGLLSRRGLIAVGAGLAALSQIDADVLAGPIERGLRAVWSWMDLHPLTTGGYVIASVLSVVLLVLILQGLSIALAVLQYSHFRLSRLGQRLTIERGLLSRARSSASLRRLQAWTLHAGIAQRMLRRRSLTVANATTAGDDDQRSFGHIAPIARPAQCDALITQLLPQARWPVHIWQRPDPRARWPLAMPGLTLGMLLAILACWHLGPIGLLALLYAAWSLFAAGRRAHWSGWHLGDAVISIREGWLARRWRLAELDKLQVVNLRRSPLQRSLGLATLSMETAGSGAGTVLRIAHMPLRQAQRLQTQLLAHIARRPMAW